MKLKKMFPLVTVKSLTSLKDYYCGHFGFQVSMETDGYLHLGGTGGAEIAFMTHDAEAPEVFGGKGITLCLEVADVDTEAARLSKANLPIVVPLKDNPWGDRSIIFRDPVGVHVYVYQAK